MGYTQPKEIQFYSKKNLKKSNNDSKIYGLIWGYGKLAKNYITVDDQGRVEMWDAVDGKIVNQGLIPKTWLNCVDIEKSEGRKIAVGSIDAKLFVLENSLSRKKKKKVQSLSVLHTLTGHLGAINEAKFLNSNYLISGSTDSTIQLWDLESPERAISVYNEHSADVTCLSIFQYDGNIFLSGSADLSTKIWDIRIKKAVQLTFKAHENSINTVEFMPAEIPTTFASGSDDSTIKFQDIRMKKEIATFFDSQNYDSIFSLKFSNSGRFIFAGTDSSKIKVWDTLGYGDSMKDKIKPDLGSNLNTGMIRKIDISCDGYTLAYIGSKSPGTWILYQLVVINGQQTYLSCQKLQ